MTFFVFISIGLIILLSISLFIAIKIAVKKDKTIKKYRVTLEMQNKIIKEFNEVENEGKKQKDKLGKGSVDDRIAASISVLQNLDTDN